MGTLAMKEAIEESRIEAFLSDAYFVSGTTVGGMDYTERCFMEIQESDEKLSVMATHDCGATSLLQADYFDINNDHVITISTACSSAANAIIMGCNLIKTGKTDIVIAGGSEAITKFHLNGFNSLMILDSERCRPFDETRTGLNLGEGAAYVILESACSVQRRKVIPIGEVLGYGNSCDAYHQTASSPDGEGAYLAMEEALRTSGLKPQQIQYINAHGTGTPNNDVSESCALNRVFDGNPPYVSSTKSFTGHTTSASGAVEAVICLLAIRHRFIPSNLGWQNQMKEGITPTLGKESYDLRYVMCNSFGFGGNDSSLILSGFDGEIHPFTPRKLRPVYVRSEKQHTPDFPVTNLKDFISPMASRRMCSLLKNAFVTSMEALKAAELEKPDGIFVGTKFGMLSNSEKFLKQMCCEGENTLGPTLFMQSSHNNIAGMLAIQTKCHGYNITFTQGKKSLDCALRDAAMQIALGNIDTALVGCHDESTSVFNDLFKRLTGEDIPPGEYSTCMVLTSSPEHAIREFTEF
jgi:3-oxoacyl-(acyl-carrier-protein) synthase